MNCLRPTATDISLLMCYYFMSIIWVRFCYVVFSFDFVFKHFFGIVFNFFSFGVVKRQNRLSGPSKRLWTYNGHAAPPKVNVNETEHIQ